MKKNPRKKQEAKPEAPPTYVEAMRKIGLEAVIEIQSSNSNGMHLWFPLREEFTTHKHGMESAEHLSIKRLELGGGDKVG